MPDMNDQLKNEFNGLLESVSSLVINTEVKETLQELERSINDTVSEIGNYANTIQKASEGFSQLMKIQEKNTKSIVKEISSIEDFLTRLEESHKEYHKKTIEVLETIKETNLIQYRFMNKMLNWILVFVLLILVPVAYAFISSMQVR
ncbi:MAG: hypothetical protein PHU99_09820 [Candidatus Cloacimonetes bacterium]|jgi:seryl-tRNA synthetase|nr:hypothetical protein [Candidatus Cloacimonadota bacterium]MCB5259368.1 hypothetical protein [Candidatus Cloacimonadota bacterium]MCK9334966.1 hypothetical protein [Candidatus Cloacimonadota bacterium]MDD3098003.1 hypothetical protein [Candidatus Cloacimonadota bacterium]MDD4034013.1 hypothetical protein [Candidatus Cloacimonadota bacterium]